MNQSKPRPAEHHDAEPPPVSVASDREAFRRLHAEVYPDVLRFVERRVPTSEAEDVVAVVFATVWRRMAEVPADARPWIFGIARYEMANHRRGSLRRRDLDVALTAHWRGDAGYSSSEDVDARLDLVAAWNTLTPRERETLALVAFDALTADQAAEVVGCRRSTFSMRLARARERLRHALENPIATAHPRYARTEGKKDSE